MDTLNKIRENSKSVIYLVILFFIYLLFRLVWPSAASLMKWVFLIIVALVLIKKFLPKIKKLLSKGMNKIKERKRKKRGTLSSNFSGGNSKAKDDSGLEWK